MSHIEYLQVRKWSDGSTQTPSFGGLRPVHGGKMTEQLELALLKVPILVNDYSETVQLRDFSHRYRSGHIGYVE